MSVKVAKFGGSSLADSSQFQKVYNIIKSDQTRKFVIPSAPGKRFSSDEKITDMLYNLYNNIVKHKDYSDIFMNIKNRYIDIKNELNLKIDIEKHIDEFLENLLQNKNRDYAASRGEYLNGLLLADYLGYNFIDPANLIFFDEHNKFDDIKTHIVISEQLAKYENAVIPGFYGSLPSGEIHTFSRGGSDITGAIVARAIKATLYENWTDVDGFYMIDPRIAPNAKLINIITYRELRELAYMGASVLHDEAIFPVRIAGIPINLRNTNNPDSEGTYIYKNADDIEVRGAITGIAGKSGFISINIEKAMMNSELGFGRRVLQCLEDTGVSFEHLPTGIDTMTIVISENSVNSKLDVLLHNIDRAVSPDTMHVEKNLALIATVGRGMVRYPGTSGRIFSSLAKADINVRMIDQGSSEINIIVGVDKMDLERAMNAIYSTFSKTE